MKLPPLLFILTIAVLVLGCRPGTTSFNQPFTSELRKNSEVSDISVKQIAKEDEEGHKTDIELKWKAPEAPVDGFVIRYGAKKDALTTSKKVYITALDLVIDKERGELYRYRLKNPPQSDPLYVSIASFVGETVSVDSELIEVIR